MMALMSLVCTVIVYGMAIYYNAWIALPATAIVLADWYLNNFVYEQGMASWRRG